MATEPPRAAKSQPPSSTDDFKFPPQHSFPPFFTIQPVLSTRTSQLTSWSTLIQAYCRHHRLFSLSLIDAVDTPLFNNARLGRRLSLADARTVIDWMCSKEGGGRAEWIRGAGGGKDAATAAATTTSADRAWIYWRRPEEWATVLEDWVDATAQRNTVLTLYELVEGEETRTQEWWGMDMELLQKCLGVLVKRGKAQVFGGSDAAESGVKFF